MSGKKQFFNKLQSALDGRMPAGPAAISPENWSSERPAYDPASLAPTWSPAECRKQLIAHLESQNSKIIELETAQKIPEAIADAVTALPGGNKIHTGDNPFIASLPWSGISSNPAPALVNAAELTVDDIESPDLVSLSTAFAAAAETGTLFLASGEDNPTHLNFLSACHIVLIDSRDICQTYEQAHALGRSLWQKDGRNNRPRTINMISGPSRTADIEQTLTLGAHGPIDLIVVIY